MGMIRKTSNAFFSHVNNCSNVKKEMGLLHQIVTGDENCVHYNNLKRWAIYGYPGCASSSTAEPNIHAEKIMLCIWWDQLGVVYYELLQPNERITGEHFSNNDDVKKWINKWIAAKEPAFLSNGIRQLPERWKKMDPPKFLTLPIPLNSHPDFFHLPKIKCFLKGKHFDYCYIGETGRSICTRLSEHSRNICTNYRKSLLCQHITEFRHSFNLDSTVCVYKGVGNKYQRLVLESLVSHCTPSFNRKIDLPPQYSVFYLANPPS
ncbi:hypothetical protein LAZ67_6004006 [Cordylochernes scorpioides]|uniref:GIY-YIG domain-containing protein n=1 Tax=Cordylochernes scorpioides TaxID=51811 RepID=A0ABY6KL34_9ARAC|nr:hypothetical protein LAZ67_6004006 [Cordylochernes scorpioides]